MSNINGDDVNLAEQWREEWKDMPEYKMTRIKPILTVKLNFRTQEDIDAFGELIGKKITPGINNYWFPRLNIKTNSEEVYVDES